MSNDEIKINRVIKYFEDNIKFGWCDLQGKIYYSDLEKYVYKYYVMSLEETMNLGIGSCHEQVLLMNKMFNDVDIQSKIYCCKVYYLNSSFPKYLHSFIIFKSSNTYNLVEHDLQNKKKIYKSDSLNDLFNIVMNNYELKAPGSNKEIFEYERLPFHVSYVQLNDYLNKNGIKRYVRSK